MLKTFQQLSYNNLMANNRLLNAALQLRAGEFEAPRTGFFPSIKKTLNHILVVDWFYVDAFEGGTLGAKAWENDQPFADPSALQRAQSEVDQRLISFCKQLDPTQLDKPLKLLRYEEPLGNVLIHLFQHQIHHRGQAHAMFSGTSVPPPQLDEFMFRADHKERENDLRDLGLSETDLPNY